MNEYEEDLRIDEYRLEECCVNQANLYAKWTRELSNAVYERDRLKDKYEMVKAETDATLRSDWPQYSDKKMTEAAVSNMLSLDEKVMETSNKLIEANRTVRELEVARQAFEHRRKMLELLVQLFIHNYYADPKIAAEARNILSPIERQREQTEALNSGNTKERMKKLIKRKGE